MKLKKLSKISLTILLGLVFLTTGLILDKPNNTFAQDNKIAVIIGPCRYCDSNQCVTSSSPSCDPNLNECSSDSDCVSPPPPPPPPPPGPPPPPPPPPPDEEEPTPPPPQPAVPRPDPYVPCNEVREPEFHSLRPYQASPCNEEYEDLALFCGNDLVVGDEVTFTKIFNSFTDDELNFYTWEGSTVEPTSPEYPSTSLQPCESCQNGECVRTAPGSCVPEAICSTAEDCSGDCVDNGDGTETCTFDVPPFGGTRQIDIAIDLEGAILPIMGFTEPSLNSEDQPNRVINSVLQDETMDDAEKVNEYVSWYLNGIIGRAEYESPNPETEEGRRKIIDFSGPLKRLFSSDSQEEIRREEIDEAGETRHNQIAVCTGALGLPVPCYPDGNNQIRLSDIPDRLLEYAPFSSTEDRKGRVRFGSYSIQPPISTSFRILYSAITNQQPAELFFSHMQESYELADIFQRTFAYQEADLEAEAEDYVTSYSPLCDLRAVRSNPGDNLFPGELSATIEYEAQVDCEFAIPDDDIPGNLCRGLSEQDGVGADCVPDPDLTDQACDVSYGQADCGLGQICAAGCSPLPTDTPCENVPPVGGSDPFDGPFSCFPSDWECTSIGSGDTSEICPSGYDCADIDSCNQPEEELPQTQECTNTLYVSFRTVTEAPLAKEVWTKLVAGPTSVFRHLFPQIEDEEGRPIRRLWDLPAATSVIYQASEGVTVIAGGPGSGRGNTGELYFRHIGGIHEYFLKCIQKTLRPEGFGEGCVSGPEPLAGVGTEGFCATPPPTDASFGQVAGCSYATGLCSPSNLQPYFEAAGCSDAERKARQASIICNGESGANPSAINCSCLSGGTDYSIGLFQINLLAHCASFAFDWDWGRACTILDAEVVDGCANRFFDPDENIEYMIQISSCGENWTPWSVYTQSCTNEIDSQ